jgi:triosephosphate isomerase
MRPLIAGNWKMHGTGPQLPEIAAIAAWVRATSPTADILICPPSTLIARARTGGRRRKSPLVHRTAPAKSPAHSPGM